MEEVKKEKKKKGKNKRREEVVEIWLEAGEGKSHYDKKSMELPTQVSHLVNPT